MLNLTSARDDTDDRLTETEEAREQTHAQLIDVRTTQHTMIRRIVKRDIFWDFGVSQWVRIPESLRRFRGIFLLLDVW